MEKTHHCGELSKKHEGKKVCLCGWADTIRDHGKLVFIDLRDREGMTQVVFNAQEHTNILNSLKPESVIAVSGMVQLRPANTVNSKLLTGEIEIAAENIEILNVCDPLPFSLDDEKADKVSEETRLTYRYLDLRRPKNQKLLKLRHTVCHTVRNFLNDNTFTEVEIPVLFKSTPEGAREFLVPSRINEGQFYALNQSPQQYKQILMVAGVERYYSIARCFRDEDLRADRQPEFTQIDLEMSFINAEDIYALIETLLKTVWKAALNIDIPTPFLRMAYKDAMNRFGCDKPDMRFGMEMQDVTEIFKNSQCKVFAEIARKGGVIKALNAKDLAHLSQGEMEALELAAKSMGSPGLAFIKCHDGQWKSPIAKFLSDAEKEALRHQLDIGENDLVFFSAADWEKACLILGRVRLEVAELAKKHKKLTIPDNQYNFLWVIDFPLLSYDSDEKRYVATHHPFTSPVKEDIGLLDSNPQAVRGQHYDIVLNGVELGGGSIRIHQPELQKRIFRDLLKIPEQKVEELFGYLLQSFRFGAPPHGGIAIGLDRLVAILGNTKSIRDVIAFPKTQKGQDLMVKSPSAVSPKQLTDLHIALLPCKE